MEQNFDLPKVTNYDLSIKVEPKLNFFNVTGTLTINNDTKDEIKNIGILLYHSLNVKAIRINDNQMLLFSQEKIALSDESSYLINNVDICLHEVLKPNSKINLLIEYEGSINGYSHLMPYIKDKIDDDFSIIRPDCHAYPIIAQPVFDSILKSYTNRFTYSIAVNVPSEYTVGCGGILKQVEQNNDGNKTFYYDSDFPTWRFDIGIARYSIIEDKDINLKIFVFPEHQNNAENIVKDEIIKAYNLFANLFGDYKKDSYFTVVEVKESYGSQASDNYIMMEEHGFGDNRTELTHLYHEIGHIWNARTKYEVQRTRFFDEGFASYFEALAIKKFYGYKAFINKMETYRNNFIESVSYDKINYNTPISEYGKYEIGYNSYTKAPWALFILNEIIGDNNFNEVIKSFLNKFKDEEAEFKDFIDICQEISRTDLSNFFSKWIYGIESSEFLLKGLKIEDIINESK